MILTYHDILHWSTLVKASEGHHLHTILCLTCSDFEDGTPTLPRKGSTLDEENGVSEGTDAASILQSAAAGGSQSSLNSSAATNTLPLDNAEQFESLKRKKETKQKGVQLWVLGVY